jgi:hypothetical protein
MGGIDESIQPSRYFGWQVTCTTGVTGGVFPECNATNSGNIVFEVNAIALEVQETSAPTLDALGNNLWYQSNAWVRGSWPVNLSASDPSGVCGMEIELNGTVLNSAADWQPDTSQWAQCDLSEVDGNVDTTSYPNGAAAVTLGFSASNAAGVVGSVSHAYNVDNVTPTVALSGPADALSTAGTQYVSATATAGPSGVRGIDCSVDGGPAVRYAAASAQVPVSGLGSHTVSCSAQSNAINTAGQYATSGTESVTMQIRQPTAAAITFRRIADALRCRREKVRVLGPVRIVKRHGRAVTVRGRARTKKVRRCRARTVVHKIVIVEIRHHRKIHVVRLKRVVLLPHVVEQGTLKIGFGRATTVSGWLGLADGSPLGGRTVQILTAPANGLQQFSSVETIETAADGLWTAAIAPGPSRLIEAAYAGDATTEPATSAAVSLTVPASVKLLRITPRRVAWGGTVRITGLLLGGYLPSSGALLRLRIGLGRVVTTYGVREHVGGRGRFSTTYTFGVGPESIHRSYWFQVASLPTGDYPYAPGNSRRLSVLVGGNPRRRACCRSRQLPK